LEAELSNLNHYLLMIYSRDRKHFEDTKEVIRIRK
jgi:hypothetical protein